MLVINIKFNTEKQAGMTMLLAILIMSAITLVTVAVSSFIVREIRASRATLFSEPAYNAAETGTEVGLWMFKRGSITAIPNCASAPLVTTINSNSTNTSATEICRSYGGGTFEVEEDKDTVIFLYNPDDINGDTDLRNPDYNYDYLSVLNRSNHNIMVDIERIDGTKVTVVPEIIEPSAVAEVINIPQVPAGPMSEGRMKVTISAPSSPATVEITTALGLPDNLNLESSGCSTRLVITDCSATNLELFSRKIEVKVPTAP